MDSDSGNATIQTKDALPWLLRDRMIAALLLAAAAVTITGYNREGDDTQSGLYPDRFWAMKTEYRQCANVVIAGDSRIFMGVSPLTLQRELPSGVGVVNYGFSGTGYGPEYLAAIPTVLKPAGPQVLVLGISPADLSPKNCSQNGFLENVRRPALYRWLSLRADWFLEATEPISFDTLPQKLLGKLPPRRWLRHFSESGWVPSALEPSGLPTYGQAREMPPHMRVDPTIQKSLIDHVRRWSAGGVRVYAFRPPISTQGARYEDACYRFDERAFREAFEQAGGHWLVVDQDAYRTYDGSHLYEEDAIHLSTDLGRLIAKDLACD